ncbi:hypothetical protein DTL21_03165 [Bremerella cremea]|uniref:Uncharacterized protein n=1 Tax=Blastopirellula marina TaxID=124 RepID=A0A2S8G628_9BACT|nr:hypothetical protein C5Y83_03165 [Blastopirellula marina]RCS51227.1 hypothetical protein DTL21_03165 [Bremerella cremea]
MMRAFSFQNDQVRSCEDIETKDVTKTAKSGTAFCGFDTKRSNGTPGRTFCQCIGSTFLVKQDDSA